jgi:hypothetical protein
VTEFEGTVRKVGDSMGVIIPARVIRHLRARPGQRIRIVVPEKVDWTAVWGKLRTTEPTGLLIRRARTDRD